MLGQSWLVLERYRCIYLIEIESWIPREAVNTKEQYLKFFDIYFLSGGPRFDFNLLKKNGRDDLIVSSKRKFVGDEGWNHLSRVYSRASSFFCWGWNLAEVRSSLTFVGQEKITLTWSTATSVTLKLSQVSSNAALRGVLLSFLRPLKEYEHWARIEYLARVWEGQREERVPRG